LYNKCGNMHGATLKISLEYYLLSSASYFIVIKLTDLKNSDKNINNIFIYREHAVVLLVEIPRYKAKGRGSDS
jgi:hypothetical protein